MPIVGNKPHQQNGNGVASNNGLDTVDELTSGMTKSLAMHRARKQQQQTEPHAGPPHNIGGGLRRQPSSVMHYSSSESALDKSYFRACAVLELPPLDMTDASKKAKVVEWTKPFFITDEDVVQLKKAFSEEVELGLEKSPERKSCLQMANTFIPELPDGTEDGDYMALDLGGTNFRVILLHMSGGDVESQRVKHFHVPEAVRLGSAERLFDFLATCILEFVMKEGIGREEIPLGFCFSFPMLQESLDIGILVNWTKSFNCPGVEGQDVVKLLNTALKKKGIHVDVVAVLNDTTGTLVAGAQADHNCAIGLIVGTGCNACYIEDARKVLKWDASHSAKEVIINMECGAFGDNGCIDFVKTQFDKEVDRECLLPGKGTLEKFISGKYLGEIIRQIVLHMAKEGPFFGNHASQRLLQFGSFSTKQMSMIEEESLEGGSMRTKEVLNDLDLIYDRDDIKALQYVCAVVSLRAAQLVSVIIASLLERMDRPSTTIAVDGSVYKLHPRLKDLLKHYTAEYAPGHKFKYMLALDGSGKGAGVVAALAKRLQENVR